MAQFDESKIINALHPEKAEVGKKYWYSDSLIYLKRLVENNSTDNIGELKQIDNDVVCIFQIHDNYSWEYLYPYEEPPKQRMTHLMLSEWCMKGKGQFKHYMQSLRILCIHEYLEGDENNEVDKDILIRPWDSEEWIEPTVDIYERDCKGGKE